MRLHRIVSSRDVKTDNGTVRCFNEINIHDGDGNLQPVIVQKNLTPAQSGNFDAFPYPEEMIRIASVCDVDNYSTCIVPIMLPFDEVWICTKKFAVQNNWI